jgi:flagellar FliL protein
MMKILLPFVLLFLGLGAGVGAGVFFRPDAVPSEVEQGSDTLDFVAPKEEPDAPREYVKMNNQFVVPVVNEDKVQALVVMSLSLEVPAGEKDAIYEREPKLRDSFLQVMFDHANMGGFDGAFTNFETLEILRRGLRDVAQKVMGEQVSDVLIVDIVRQDY